MCVCVCVRTRVWVYFLILFRASEWFIVTPNLTQQDKMLPLALLFSALFLSSHFLLPFFFLFPGGRKEFMVVTAELEFSRFMESKNESLEMLSSYGAVAI